MKYETVLVRLSNNDRIIGQLLHIDKGSIALYAPMLINYDVDDDQMEITLYPYDPLSDTVMAIFESYHLLTYTVPKKKVAELYNKNWSKFYAELSEVREKMLKDMKDKYGEENVIDSSDFKGSKKLH
jgi:hypothetical protein